MQTEQIIAFIKKNPISVGCGALALILAALIYFTSGSVPDARSQLADLSSQEEKLQANIEFSAKLAEQYASLVDANKAIATRMVKPSQLALNLQYFYKLESDTQTKLIDIHQSPSPTYRGGKPTYAPVEFGLSVEGDYPSIIDVVRRLENGPHFCRITEIGLNGLGGDGRMTDNIRAGINMQLEGEP